MKSSKLVTSEQAAQVVMDGDTIVTGGFVGIGFAEELAVALRDRFDKTKSPKDLTLVYAAGQGDGKEKGLNHFAVDGLIKRVIGGHWGLAPTLGKMALENKIEAYNFPQGVLSHLFRDIAAKKPGTITSVGLNTFVDPRLEGGKINEKTKEELVRIIMIDGKEYLFLKTFPINVAFLRGTTSDEKGNITMEKEALTAEALAIAMATKNSGGIVIVQVERITTQHRLSPQLVKIPGIMVDYVVVGKPENHWQTFSEKYNPAYSGEIRVPSNSIRLMDFDIRKIIARRAAIFLKMNAVVNLGIGMPEGVASVAFEEGILDTITLTVEPGGIGGIPSGGLSFGAVSNADAIIDQPNQFDFYDGGGVDQAFLGMAEIDSEGNINVSKFGSKLAGAGGFINISQNSKSIYFLGTFTSNPNVKIENGKLIFGEDNSTKKFVKKVNQITFSGRYASSQQKDVYYITERCVFKLVENGLELIEIAPGVDLERDILDKMDFKPLIARDLKTMPEFIFWDKLMGLAERKV